MGKALGKQACTQPEFLKWLNQRCKEMQEDIENDAVIRDQKSSFGCLLVCTFGNFLMPVLVAVDRVNKLDLGH